MIFICHSTEDKSFVDRLVLRLIEERIQVWLDTIQIRVGDSLFDKIQNGLARMDFLAIVLSPRSVQSAWCNEELKAALGRQIAERKTIVLPILIEDCEIPIFLREKKYADFRASFDFGLHELLDAVTHYTDVASGAVDSDDFKVDYAFEHGLIVAEGEERLCIRIDSVSFSKHFQYSVLAVGEVIGDPILTKRYLQFVKADLAEFGAMIILGYLAVTVDTPSSNVTIEKGSRVDACGGVVDPNLGACLEYTIRCRRLGEPVDHIVFHWGTIFGNIFRNLRSKVDTLPNDVQKKINEILKSPL